MMMMLKISFSIFFVFSIFIIPAKTSDEQLFCEERCIRLKNRSLNRIGYDDERLEIIFNRQRPSESLKDVCWRLYDNIDCMKKCAKSEKHQEFAKKIRNKCSFVLQDIEPSLKCISKHQSFLKMRCSSFLNEASRLRSETDLSETPRLEECRLLHLNQFCLENAISSFCENATKLFRRINFRDYFLNYALPNDDQLFDDEDLDSCQEYDFVKNSEIRRKEKEEEEKEEEKRRRIENEDDDDYEEELTTIINGIENSENLDLQNQKSFPTEKTEFTDLINELIDSAEKDENSTRKNQEADYSDDEDQGEQKKSPIINIVSIETRGSDEIETTTTTNSDSTTFLIQLKPPENNESIESTLSIPKEIVASIQNEEDSEEIVEAKAMNKGFDDFSSIDQQKIDIGNGNKKVFADDSLEQTPPNFFYSSIRSVDFDKTTRSNYVLDKIENEDVENPLEIDTSTLFGIELFSTTAAPSKLDVSTTFSPNKNTQIPWLNGGVVVKPILNFDQIEEDSEEKRENERRNRFEEAEERRRRNEKTENEGNKYEILVVTGLIALVVFLLFIFFLIFLTCFCYSKKDRYDVQKNNGQPSA